MKKEEEKIESPKEEAITLEDLKTTYRVIKELMDKEKLNYDNSFTRVKNWLANKLCGLLIEK
jgi:hypothetical protein